MTESEHYLFLFSLFKKCLFIFYLLIWLCWVLVASLWTLVAVHSLSSSSLWAQEMWHSGWISPRCIESCFPALQGRFLPLGHQGNLDYYLFLSLLLFWYQEKFVKFSQMIKISQLVCALRLHSCKVYQMLESRGIGNCHVKVKACKIYKNKS